LRTRERERERERESEGSAPFNPNFGARWDEWPLYARRLLDRISGVRSEEI